MHQHPHPLEGKYEPESRDVQTPLEAAAMSIAISLKRIADHLEPAAHIDAANPAAILSLIEENKRMREALVDAETELGEAEDKFWVMHCNHPGDDPKREMLTRRRDEDKAFMAVLSERMGVAKKRARAALEPQS